MTAFGFKFGKKPMDFSKMKEGLSPNGTKKTDLPAGEKPQAADNAAPEPAKKPQAKPAFDLKRSLPRMLILVLMLLLFGAGLIVFFNQKRVPKPGEKMPEAKPATVQEAMPETEKKANIMDKIKSMMPGAKKAAEEAAPEEAAREGGEAAAPAEEEAVEELVTVRTYRIARGDFIDVLPGMGSIKGDKEVELRFSMDGVIDSINFFEGDLVRKGDIIATLAQKDQILKLEHAKSKLKEKEAELASSQKKVEINQKLYDEGIIIKAKLEEVLAEADVIKAQVTSAQKEVEFSLSELDKTYLYSPIDGVMGTKEAQVGEYVNSNIKICTLYDTATVLAEMGVIEKDISRVALGQGGKVNVETYPGVDFEGKIENIAPIVAGKSRTLSVKIRIKNDNPKGTLLPGMFARIWISVYEKKNTIKVPQACVYDINGDGELDSVYTVGEDNIAKATPAKIGYVSADYIELIDGVREGEQVVSEAMAELKDGVRVDVIEVQEPAL